MTFNVVHSQLIYLFSNDLRALLSPFQNHGSTTSIRDTLVCHVLLFYLRASFTFTCPLAPRWRIGPSAQGFKLIILLSIDIFKFAHFDMLICIWLKFWCVKGGTFTPLLKLEYFWKLNELRFRGHCTLRQEMQAANLSGLRAVHCITLFTSLILQGLYSNFWWSGFDLTKQTLFLFMTYMIFTC